MSLLNRSYLVWWPIVEVLEEYDPTVRDILSRRQVKCFPDRSVCLSEAGQIQSFWDRLHLYCQGGLMLRENTLYRALGCFPYRSFQLLTTWDYFDRIGGEQDFLVIPTDFMPAIAPNELRPEELRCIVQFCHRPSKQIVHKLDDACQHWSVSTRDGSSFEGPGEFRAGSVRASGRARCSFTVDVSQSGQDSVNWLILSLLNFGATVSPISEILLGRLET